MTKLYFSIFMIFAFLRVNTQNPVAIDPETIDLETDFIAAMQDVALEEYDDALVEFKKIKNKVKNDGIVDFEIAKIYLVKNEVEEAEKYAKKAIHKDDTKSIYKLFLLDVLQDQNKYEEAAQLMESMLNKSHFERVDYFKTAGLYQKAKNTKKALAVLNLLEEKTGFDKEVELQKVNVLLRNKNYKKALKTLDDLIKKQGDNVDVLSKKAMTFRLMNDNKKATETYKRILKIDSQNPVALSYLHTAQRFAQKEEDYIKSLFPMLENDKISLDKKIKMLIPFVEKVSKNSPVTADLMTAAKIILKQYPDDAKSNALMADILYNSDNLAESEIYYKKSLDDSKRNFEIWKQLMTIYSYLEKWQKLAKLSEEAIDYYPNQVIGYYNAGKAYINLEKPKKGLDLLEEALTYTGEKTKIHNEILLMITYGYLKDGKIKKAEKTLKNIDENFGKNHPYYWELMGDIANNKGEVENAKNYWQKSLKMGNNTKRLLNKLKKD